MFHRKDRLSLRPVLHSSEPAKPLKNPRRRENRKMYSHLITFLHQASLDSLFFFIKELFLLLVALLPIGLCLGEDTSTTCLTSIDRDKMLVKFHLSKVMNSYFCAFLYYVSARVRILAPLS